MTGSDVDRLSRKGLNKTWSYMLGHKILGVSLPIFNHSGWSLVICREWPLYLTQLELGILCWQWKTFPEGLYSWTLPPQTFVFNISSLSPLDKNSMFYVDSHDRIYCIKQNQLNLWFLSQINERKWTCTWPCCLSTSAALFSIMSFHASPQDHT